MRKPPKLLSAGHDAAHGLGEGRVRTVRTLDLREAYGPAWDAWEAAADVAPDGRLRLLNAFRQVVDIDRVVDVQREVRGENTWTNGYIAALWDAQKRRVGFGPTHLELGTSATAPARTDVALTAPLAPRKPITDVVIDGEYFRTSTFLTSSDFAGQTLREGGLWDAVSGGTLIDHLLWAPALAKLATESAQCDLNLRLVPA